MPADRRVLLLLIHSRFAERILAGSKTVELRRVRPGIEPGDRVLLYASSPVRGLTGSSGAARKWGTTQLNRSLVLALVAQFQGFCRDLHDEAARVHVDAAIEGQKQTLHLLIRQGRRLDTHNPRRSVLGHDFARRGFSLLEDLKATGPTTVAQLELLDALVDYRNAVGHGDEARIATLEAEGRIRATKKSYMEHRRSLDGLAGTIDSTVAAGLARVLGTSEPW